jgi:RNase P subunit RPR2
MEKEWRCKECDTLLGVERGARLYLRYKQAQYIVDGDFAVLAVCRNCTTVNERSKTERAQERADARA